MKRNKKGTDAATSMPNAKNMATHQYYSNTYKTLCLLLILAFFILVVAGTLINNDLLTTLGLGLGASGGIILARINTQEDE